jgi:hypothetical protein
MAFLKKYANFSGKKTKEVAIIFIVLILVISYGLFYYLQNNTESNIRNSLFEQQKQRQIGSTLALSQHIGSDLDSILARLQDIANSVYLQQGDLSSNTTKKSMEQMYIHSPKRRANICWNQFFIQRLGNRYKKYFDANIFQWL